MSQKPVSGGGGGSSRRSSKKSIRKITSKKKDENIDSLSSYPSDLMSEAINEIIVTSNTIVKMTIIPNKKPGSLPYVELSSLVPRNKLSRFPSPETASYDPVEVERMIEMLNKNAEMRNKNRNQEDPETCHRQLIEAYHKSNSKFESSNENFFDLDDDDLNEK